MNAVSFKINVLRQVDAFGEYVKWFNGVESLLIEKAEKNIQSINRNNQGISVNMECSFCKTVVFNESWKGYTPEYKSGKFSISILSGENAEEQKISCVSEEHQTFGKPKLTSFIYGGFTDSLVEQGGSGEAGLLSVVSGACYVLVFSVEAIGREMWPLDRVLEYMQSSMNLRGMVRFIDNSKTAMLHMIGGNDRDHLWIPYGHCAYIFNDPNNPADVTTVFFMPYYNQTLAKSSVFSGKPKRVITMLDMAKQYFEEISELDQESSTVKSFVSRLKDQGRWWSQTFKEDIEAMEESGQESDSSHETSKDHDGNGPGLEGRREGRGSNSKPKKEDGSEDSSDSEASAHKEASVALSQKLGKSPKQPPMGSHSAGDLPALEVDAPSLASGVASAPAAGEPTGGEPALASGVATEAPPQQALTAAATDISTAAVAPAAAPTAVNEQQLPAEAAAEAEEVSATQEADPAELAASGLSQEPARVAPAGGGDSGSEDTLPLSAKRKREVQRTSSAASSPRVKAGGEPSRTSMRQRSAS